MGGMRGFPPVKSPHQGRSGESPHRVTAGDPGDPPGDPQDPPREIWWCSRVGGMSRQASKLRNVEWKGRTSPDEDTDD